jgi:Arc/MetJ-type ribon-helix-helix transcriptional regulator
MEETRTITVELPAATVASFEAEVAAGHYPSLDAAVRAGLDELRAQAIIAEIGGAEALRKLVEEGRDDTDEGEDGEEFLARLYEKYDAMARARGE